jgi:hypothetical protein
MEVLSVRKIKDFSWLSLILAVLFLLPQFVFSGAAAADTTTGNSITTATLSSIAITTPADKTTYFVGDTLDISGLVVTGTYADGTTQVETVTDADVSGFDSSTAATGQVLTVTLGGKTTTFTVDIQAAAPVEAPTSIAITTPATKLTYTVGDALDLTGLVVTGTYSDGTTKVETVTDADVSGFDSSAPATGQVLTVTLGGQTTTYTVSVLLQTTTPPQPIAPLFSDVSATYWGYNAISSLSSKGIVSGYPDRTFKPEASITRAEFATMLVKALGLNTSGTTGTFTDVTADAWYYGTVNAAASASLVSGMGDNLFAPNTLITREQMAVMVTKALGNKAPTTDGTELNAFSDKSAVSSWAVSGMEEAVKSSIVSGMTPSTIAPQADATRAQAAEMIYNLLPVLGK